MDATHLISKTNLWKERDKAIKAGLDRLDNETVSRLSADPDARAGRKGGFKWFGYKLHTGVCMSHGLIVRKRSKGKDQDLDRWLTGVRMPYEGIFARFQKRARYRGLVKCQFQGFMQALAHNFKRLLTIDGPPLVCGPSCA